MIRGRSVICVLLLAVSALALMTACDLSDNTALRQTARAFLNRYDLNIVGVTESTDEEGRPCIVGLSLQGSGCYDQDQARTILLDCRSILLDELSSCPDSVTKFGRTSPDDTVLIISFCDESRYPTPSPFVCFIRFSDGRLFYGYCDSDEARRYNRKVSESLEDALKAVHEGSQDAAGSQGTAAHDFRSPIYREPVQKLIRDLVRQYEPGLEVQP